MDQREETTAHTLKEDYEPGNADAPPRAGFTIGND